MNTILKTYQTQKLALESTDYLNAVRLLAKPVKAESLLLDVRELKPRIDPVTVQDAPPVFEGGILKTPAKAHTEFVLESDFVPQVELTPAQLAEGWTMIFTKETLAQYQADNAEAIAVEVAAMTPPEQNNE